MVPGLEARLLEGSDDDVVRIAELVGLPFHLMMLCIHRFERFKGARQVQDLTTRKV
jgi:hypothetical protein